MNQSFTQISDMRLSFTVIFCFCILRSNISYSQNCNCSSNFQWLKKTFEENDAGFKYNLSVKGRDFYDYHNKAIQEKINNVKTDNDCLPILQEWLRFFRKGHLYIRSTGANNATSTSPEVLDTVAIKNQFRDWPRYQLNIEEFKTYLGKKKTQDFEGIWESAPYKIAIKKTGNEYKGILINDLPPYWEEGQVKLEITNIDGKQRGVAYQRDHSKTENENVEEIGQNYLKVSSFWLKRLFPVLPTETEVQNWLKLYNRNTYLNQLDKNTLYFRMPSFGSDYKKAIDSVLVANKQLLSRTPNLIIDIRGNGGGSDFSFNNIIPYLKTNEINVTGVEYLSTTLNNQRMMDFVTNPKYKDFFTNKQKEWAKESFATLQKHLGEFVLLDESFEDDDTNTSDAILPFPKQVGIIIDDGVGSSAEQFLLAAKQSKKVKLFGTSTFGSLDISNMYFVKSPCSEYELGYSLSKSKRLPKYVLDERGIQPDFFISEDVPGYHWVSFVKTVLEYTNKK
jgi:hypothetical protein